MSGSFFDTNVLFYLALRDPSKAGPVDALVRGGGTISIQVLNEIVHVSRRKHRKPWPEIMDFLHGFTAVFDVMPLTLDIHEHGLRLAQRHNFSTYDAMIVAAALSAGCDTLWSEDMQHGMVVDGRLTIRNPFLS